MPVDCQHIVNILSTKDWIEAVNAGSTRHAEVEPPNSSTLTASHSKRNGAAVGRSGGETEILQI
jgi:hypothetical protein